MSPDVLLECPRTSYRNVLRVNVTERVWIFPLKGEWGVQMVLKEPFCIYSAHAAEREGEFAASCKKKVAGG